MGKRLILLTLCLFLLGSGTGMGRDLDALQHSLWQKRQARERTEAELSALTKKERSLHNDLKSLEERVSALQTKEEKLEDRVQAARSRREEIADSIADVQSRQGTIRAELEKLLPRLWELSIRSEHLKSKVFSSWPEADRQVAWLKSLTGPARDKLQTLEQLQAEAHNKERSLQANLATLSSRQEKLASVRKEVMGKRLEFARRLHAVRTEQKSGRKELQALEASIARMKSRLKSLDRHDLVSWKGRLPWPANGEVVQRYGAAGKRSSDGLGLALSQGEKVRAIAWGKVAYNDVLRGFGQVIIIYHGQHYYSLYAYLSKTSVQVGQKVDKGEVIGRAGYYPKSQGPGLYFELRRKQTPIDPRPWLISRK